MNKIKKVMAIHDMSCYGRASLTTIIPIISVMGAQVCPLPTAILSTHTGGYGKPAIVELGGFMKNASEHWKSLEIMFDCIYTGYLPSAKQVDEVLAIIKEFKKNETLLVVDPVMADKGKLYSGMNEDIIIAMRNLIKNADIITPNITEVAFLLNENYNDRNNYNLVDEWARNLALLGPKNIIITSAPSKLGDEYIDNIIFSVNENKVRRISTKKIDKYFPGTGDAFASVIVGKMLRGETLFDACKFAGEFIKRSIEISSEANTEAKEGILLEKVLNLLTN
ncbi:MAG: pyridoxamine kinase [Sarcina sp.]